jgi:hypothetical protein
MSKVKESSEWPPNTYAGRKILRHLKASLMAKPPKNQDEWEKYLDYQERRNKGIGFKVARARPRINVPISKVTASKRFKRMAKKIGLPKKETAEQWHHNAKLYPTLEHIKEGPKPIPRGFYDPGDGGEDLINKNLGKIYKTGGRKTRRRRKKKGKRKTKRKTKKRKKRKKKKTKKKSF